MGGQRNPAALFAITVAEQEDRGSVNRASCIIEKIRTDFPAGELKLQNIDSFKDQPIARGVAIR
jgi:hypothetical protein